MSNINCTNGDFFNLLGIYAEYNSNQCSAVFNERYRNKPRATQEFKESKVIV